MMETRKDTLCALKLCRFCLSQDETLTSLYDRSRAPKNSIPLPLKILSCVSIEIFPSDKMPSYICNRCKFFMDISYEFKQMCRQADENVLQYIQTGSDLNSATWPSSLQKLFRVASKSAPELAVMKTIVEGGATVQVTANGSDSEEEDDENVYNVKIGDGSDEGPKNARVKVITGKQNKSKNKQDKDTEESDLTPRAPEVTLQEQQSTGLTELQNQEPSATVDEATDLQNGCWPCDVCDCSYPLQQLLNLHKLHKHRQRNVQCNQCDAKFFNQYDLGTHQLRHTPNEIMYQCVVCGKEFKRRLLLKRHEKSIHADIAQLACPSCPATFLSQEELKVHSKKHRPVQLRRFACTKCNKRFQEKGTLLRHRANVHDRIATFKCFYCPARFASLSKLTRHVRSHAGERSYPCKYCDKSFIKSHHYTRHLRIKHREAIRTARGPFGETMDQYRCEQCEDTFATQDELIYHSAIHATQNLICPLCQEKFEDVDAVTAHIKSHVNGTEFMCDLCELVFTTKEKLDNHINNAHEDELRSEGQDESSVDMEAEDDEDDGSIKLVKEDDDHMVVEIKKADGFMLVNSQGDEIKPEQTNSEESDTEMTFTELATVDTLAITRTEPAKIATEKPEPAATPGGAIITKTTAVPAKSAEKNSSQTAPILRKAEENKRKVQPEEEQIPDKKNKKSESNNTGANDKSLRLLEEELQELKRTNTRSEVVKTPPVKSIEIVRNRRPQIHTSTPKLRAPAVEEKKTPVPTKSPALEKKQSERRIVTKENKEPKEVKEIKGNNSNAKDEKEVKEKEKEIPKNVIKNGTPEKSPGEEGIRRSTRPSKIKDYAKMIRDRSQDSEEDDSDEVDEEYTEAEKIIEKPKLRRGSTKPSPKPAPPPAVAAPAVLAPRKRGRPRKDAGLNVPTPAKVKKAEKVEEAISEEEEVESEEETKPKENAPPKGKTNEPNIAASGSTLEKERKSPTDANLASGASGVLMSPTGQTLKKVPIKSLPPGVKPMPLPANARTMVGGEVCEMQIGKKVVKVQKIVMTKAEVEAMAKKGLVEMKDGTMVLKQGIKLPTSDASALKNLVGDESAKKESPSKTDKAIPTRCDIDEEN